MCTGLEVLGALGGIAGSAMSAIGAAQQQREAEANAQRQADARNEVLRQTMAKNDALAQQSREDFATRKQQITADAMNADQAKEQANRENQADQAIQDAPLPVNAIPLTGDQPEIVKSDLAKRMGTALQSSKDLAAKKAALASVGDMWLNQGFQNADIGRQLQEKANFQQGNLAILPFQQDIAEQRAYKPISSAGALLGGFGNMLSSYSGSLGGGASPKTSLYKSGY